jgi:protein-S-isoprenylcysteine O-methyltransferase Ste14
MPMELLGRITLTLCWVAWLYPFLFRAPHNQKRPSVTRKGATLVGLLLESAAICIASTAGLSSHEPSAWWRVAGMLIFAVPSIALAWSAVKNLGKQFRVNAGLYEDHELVRTGAYSIVRHPIYAALLGMLLATIALATPWQWAAVSLVLFISGTEIRVHVEDGLLASRFPEAFEEYRRRVPAYLPFLR